MSVHHHQTCNVVRILIVWAWGFPIQIPPRRTRVLIKSLLGSANSCWDGDSATIQTGLQKSLISLKPEECMSGVSVVVGHGMLGNPVQNRNACYNIPMPAMPSVSLPQSPHQANALATQGDGAPISRPSHQGTPRFGGLACFESTHLRPACRTPKSSFQSTSPSKRSESFSEEFQLLRCTGGSSTYCTWHMCDKSVQKVVLLNQITAGIRKIGGACNRNQILKPLLGVESGSQTPSDELDNAWVGQQTRPVGTGLAPKCPIKHRAS